MRIVTALLFSLLFVHDASAFAELHQAELLGFSDIGDGARQVIDLGYEERGYHRCAWTTGKGDVLMAAGCHVGWRLDTARVHWGSPDYPDRTRGDAYLRLIDFIEAEAKARGWLDPADPVDPADPADIAAAPAS